MHINIIFQYSMNGRMCEHICTLCMLRLGLWVASTDCDSNMGRADIGGAHLHSGIMLGVSLHAVLAM